MDNKEKLRKSLEAARKSLNEQGIHYDGKNGIADWKAIKPFEVAYQDCIEKIWPDNAWWELTNYWDIFDEMASGVSDEDIIDEIVDHIDEGRVSDEESKETEEGPKEVKESKELEEGTSNFGSDGGADFLPLLVFMEYETVIDQVIDAAQEAYDSLGDESVDWDGFRDDYVDEHMGEYTNGVCVLDESQVDELRDDIFDFNEKLHVRGENIMNDANAKEAGKDADDEYSRGDTLHDTNVSIEPGYYEGAYLNCDFDSKDVTHGEDDLSDEDADFISDFYQEMKSKHGLTEIGVAWHASNGETGYSIKDEEIVDEKKKRNPELRTHLNRNAGNPAKNAAFFNHAMGSGSALGSGKNSGSGTVLGASAGSISAASVGAGGAAVGGASEALGDGKGAGLDGLKADLFKAVASKKYAQKIWDEREEKDGIVTLYLTKGAMLSEAQDFIKKELAKHKGKAKAWGNAFIMVDLNEGPSEALKEGKNLTGYDKTFADWLELSEFELVGNDDGTYSLHDLQGGNLGDIDSDEFSSAAAIVDRMDVYVTDYILRALDEVAESYKIDNFKDYGVDFGGDDAPWSLEQWDALAKNPKFRKDHSDFVSEEEVGGDLPYVDLFVNHIDEVDLAKVLAYEMGSDAPIGGEPENESKKPEGKGVLSDAGKKCLKRLGRRN